MTGAGMLAKVGNAKKLPLVDLPKDTIVLVDVMAFFFDIIKTIAQKRSMVDICSMLLRRFDDHPAVEFYLDGHGNQQKLATSLERRDKSALLREAEIIIGVMDGLARQGRRIKRSLYKRFHKILRSVIVIGGFEKTALVTLLVLMDKNVTVAPGEADLAIRQRADELVKENKQFVVVGNDCDYCIHPSIPVLLRPRGEKYVRYDIDKCLEASGMTRAQYTALGITGNSDYSLNPPGIGIATSTKIIKEVSERKSTFFLVFFFLV